MKKCLLIILCVTLLVSLCSCGFNSSKQKTEDIVYEDIRYYDVFDEFRENEIRAEDTYFGRYATFTGELYHIADYGISLEVDYYNSNDSIHKQHHIFCKFEKLDNSIREDVMALNIGDRVMVKGEIYELTAKEIAIKLHSVEVIE